MGASLIAKHVAGMKRKAFYRDYRLGGRCLMSGLEPISAYPDLTPYFHPKNWSEVGFLVQIYRLVRVNRWVCPGHEKRVQATLAYK